MHFYEVLCSDKDADLSEIKKRYQALILKHHPDKKGGEETKDFLQIREAWQVLREE